MKTRKLGVNFTKNMGVCPNKSQQQQSSILRFALLTKSSAGILPAFMMIVFPSFLGVFSSPAVANNVSDNPLSRTLAEVRDSRAGKVGKVEKAGETTVVPSSSEEKSEEKTEVAQTTSATSEPNTSVQEPAPQPAAVPTVEPKVQVQTTPLNNTPQTVTKGKPQIEFAPVGNPQVQADGRSTIKLQGQITDENGQPITKDVMVTLTTTAGKFVGADQDTDASGFQVRAIAGEFTATLQSDIKAQQVRIRAAVDSIQVRDDSRKTPPVDIGQPSFPNGSVNITGQDKPFPQQTDTSILEQVGEKPLEAYAQVEFTTYLRPSLATGIVNFRIGQRGTNYWGSYRDFLNPDHSGGTQVDFYSAVFATGKVGDWLFTGAYNSARPLNQDCEQRNRLFGGIQFCDQQYPVYGDSSTFTSTAPSIDSVYARLERSSPVPGAEPDYLMWGDYNTEEFARTSQLYTATSRQLHGLKANYNLGNFQLTGLYANNIEGFQRDTFVPNGLSGNYFLSKRLIIPGSETVYLEEEEINRPGTVKDRKQLFRGPDYEIDYDRGSLTFRRPILATELNPFGATLVRKVVVTYQNDGGKNSNLVGGRLQFNFSQDRDNRSFLAGSYLREDQGDRDFQLFGADFLISLGNSGRIVGEFARSNNSDSTILSNNAAINGRSLNGSAYRLEAFGNFGDRIQAEAYYRGVEPNFSNNSTASFSPGQTRYGASLLARVTDTTRFNVGYEVEENYGTTSSGLLNFIDLFDPRPLDRPGSRVNNELRTFRAGILQQFGSAEAGIEYVNRSRDDRVSNRFDGDASQLVSRLKVPLTQSLLFQAQNELNLGDSDPLYPNRTTLGLDWKAYPGVTFRLAHQFFDKSELIRGNSLTTLDTIVDHKFSENTAVTGRYSILSGFNGLQGQGALGLDQGIRIAPGLKLNLGYQYVFKNIFNATATGDRFGQYYAVGQTASTLGLFSGSVYSVGLEYTDNPDFKASGRFEYRDGDEGNSTYISAAMSGKISPALTALVRYQQAGQANVFLPSSVGITSSDIRFQELGDTGNLRIGLAYRDPTNDKFNALLKYEWRQNFDSIPETQITGTTATGHVFSAEAIYAPSWRWEFYGKYALRNGVTFLDGDRYDGTVNLAQLRASYRLGYRTDLAVEGRWIGQNSNSGTDYDEIGLAVESGYYLTPDLRVGVGYSFGSVDDRDFTGYRSEGGFYLNISLKLNELLAGFGLQKPVPKQQRESEGQPTAQGQSGSNSGTKIGLVKRLKQQALKGALKTTQSDTSKTRLINHLRQQAQPQANASFTGVQE
jgi:hypothetical protein